jgi:hypothetical protein
MDVMPEELQPSKTVSVVRGQLHTFMLIPIIPEEIEWFSSGPITFGVEARVLGTPDGVIGERGSSIHVFNAARTEEYLRFDCFQRVMHYHYILNAEQSNIVWGYDPDVNGPMLPWAINALRTRLSAMLRNARADTLADQVEREGFDLDVLHQVEAAMQAAWERTFPGTHMVQKGIDWYARWKKIHPQFNTVDY